MGKTIQKGEEGVRRPPWAPKNREPLRVQLKKGGDAHEARRPDEEKRKEGRIPYLGTLLAGAPAPLAL